MTSIGAKVEYVKAAAAGPRLKHHCHWPGCAKECPPSMWGCKAHWFKLPAALRSKIWRTFEPGQEVSKTPSRAYVEAAREVQAWIMANATPAQGSLL